MSLVIFGMLFLLKVTHAVDFPWMYYLPYGEDVTLRPLYKNKTEDMLIKSCKWTTPNQVDLRPEMSNYDVNRYYIERSNCELTIYNNQKDTNGVYHCTVNDFLISKAMLNVHGAPKASLLEEYTPNLIAGFSTAGGLFLLLNQIFNKKEKQLIFVVY